MFRRNFQVMFLLFVLLGSLCGAELVRFQQVDQGLFRSGQPENEKDYLFLKKLGIRTIINLRNDSSVIESANRATSLGLKQINIPLNTQTTSPEYKEAVKQFFEIISDPQAQPILFHCRHGKDRTGLMAAMYRVFNQRLTPKNAFTEWRSMGLSDEWGTKIQEYFWDAVRDEIHPVKSNSPTCARMLK